MQRFVMVLLMTWNGSSEPVQVLGDFPTVKACYSAQTPQSWRLIDWVRRMWAQGIDVQAMTMCRLRVPSDPPPDALSLVERAGWRPSR